MPVLPVGEKRKSEVKTKKQRTGRTKNSAPAQRQKRPSKKPDSAIAPQVPHANTSTVRAQAPGENEAATEELEIKIASSEKTTAASKRKVKAPLVCLIYDPSLDETLTSRSKSEKM